MCDSKKISGHQTDMSHQEYDFKSYAAYFHSYSYLFIKLQTISMISIIHHLNALSILGYIEQSNKTRCRVTFFVSIFQHNEH
ncbi:hypothetical protein BpHYR1_052825 [Brachionus plicatilis]|uniref:Uncharacterized protein n=1 Tax=Brachionus plicatilis TaxID=10195 RepID=A0A3M7P9L4_BRAPC|nr:hypothetical protein BpHYR1_052825 [Brachionus plicatilis]